MTYFDEPYIKDDTCPACGAYTANGDICKQCKEKYGLEEEKLEYDRV